MMIPQGPIHITPGGDVQPHLTVQDVNGQMWHVPYQGQTTLDMFTRPNFDPRPQWNNIAQNNLGILRADLAKPG